MKLASRPVRSNPYLRYGFILIAVLVVNTNLFSQTPSDSLMIRATVLDYLEGLEYNDTLRVTRALHPDLAKRVVSQDKAGKDKLDNMSAATLIHYTKTFDYTQLYKKGVDPKATLKVDVDILDLSDGIATVKATQNKFAFFDYIHLGLLNGEWKIINVLWAWTP
ncbi:putative lumazine-binding protein [Flavobacteriaceae bacterium MAR_2010_105]|nr:putative lumazine-binding protein [Flavobacteriaceae bacterium MAR_2010_105]